MTEAARDAGGVLQGKVAVVTGVANEEVADDAQGKLELVATDDLDQASVDPEERKAQVPKQAERAAVEQAFAERVVEQEAEQNVVAEAREQTNSAAPPERGALTTESPTAE